MSSSYAVFSYAADLARGLEIPVGIALWSSSTGFAQIRLVQEGEKLTHFKPASDLPYVSLVRNKVAHWIEQKRLPYADESLTPCDNAWWAHARKLLIHRIRMSEPRPVDCADPAADIELLYESVVAPYRSHRERNVRVDGEISRCLNHLALRFSAHAAIPGVGERNVVVTRAYEGEHATVVVEGLNLAHDPDRHSDLALGKLLRVRDGNGQKCEIMIGYLTSPGGLNGEKVLVDYICRQTGAKAFDLFRDKSAFRAEAGRLLERADGVQGMYPDAEE